MAEKKAYMVGNIRLSDLNGFEDTVKQGVRGCFIPYDQNPSLYIGTSKQTGALTVDMDILVRETRASKTGASHFVKLSVGKANRERFQLSQEALDSLKIVGNLYTRTPAQAGQAQGQQGAAPAPQGGYQQRPSQPAPAREATRLPPTPERRRALILPRREAEQAGRRTFFRHALPSCRRGSMSKAK